MATLKHYRQNGHRPSFSKFPLGYAGISNRLSYGTEVDCECGWSAKVNEPKPEAVVLHNDHLREVKNLIETGAVMVRFTLDYTDHYLSILAEAEENDREAIVAYATVVAEKREGHVLTLDVAYGGDGWVARELAEETEAQIGPHGSMERLANA